MTSTLTDYIELQDELLKAASEALPHQFSQCTYPLGHLRQAVYLCLTCKEPRGICSACSIACHTNHEQVELFPKRNFRCDCPTSAIPNPCTLHTNLEEENKSNVYGRNFKNEFCRCGRPYDAKTEPETMIQCLACEDWFHESCCNLRERPTPDDGLSEQTPDLPDPGKAGGEQGEPGEEDARSETSSSGLPPPLISGEDYEAFVCGDCVLKNPVLKQWAGTPGVTIVTRSGPSDPWRRVDEYGDRKGSSTEVDIVNDQVAEPLAAGCKRPLSPSQTDANGPEAKRARAGSGAAFPERVCLAPKLSPIAQVVLSRLESNEDGSFGTGDIFLSEGFRERWCRCSSCLPILEANRCLLEDEETYEPPEDPDSGLSLEELGMRALERIPRDRAIDGIHAFNGMKDDLIKFLRPFAQEGKTVGENDVRDFFATLTEAAAKTKR